MKPLSALAAALAMALTLISSGSSALAAATPSPTALLQSQQANICANYNAENAKMKTVRAAQNDAAKALAAAKAKPDNAAGIQKAQADVDKAKAAYDSVMNALVKLQVMYDDVTGRLPKGWSTCSIGSARFI